jgi:phosphohistidine phosphatase
MLTLTLMRHAKSSWDDAEADDHDRTLARRGSKDAPAMAKWLAAQGVAPDLVLCSSAARTRATLTLVLPALAHPPAQIAHERGIYLATPETLLGRLREVEDGVTSVLLIGHNPGMHALALDLAGTGRRRSLAQLALKFPTSGIAIFDIDRLHWRDLAPGCGSLRAFMAPKMLV